MGDYANERYGLIFETRRDLEALEKEVRERDHSRQGDIKGIALRVTDGEKSFAVVVQKVETMESSFRAMRSALYGAAATVVVAAVTVIMFAHGA